MLAFEVLNFSVATYDLAEWSSNWRSGDVCIVISESFAVLLTIINPIAIASLYEICYSSRMWLETRNSYWAGFCYKWLLDKM